MHMHRTTLNMYSIFAWTCHSEAAEAAALCFCMWAPECACSTDTTVLKSSLHRGAAARQVWWVQAHEVEGSGTTASFRQFQVDQIAADMKESICRVSDNPFDAQENVNIPTVSYEVSPSEPTLCTCLWQRWSWFEVIMFLERLCMASSICHYCTLICASSQHKDHCC